MTVKRLELCLASAITMAAGSTTAMAQQPAPQGQPTALGQAAPPPAAAPQAPAQYPAAQPYPGQPYPGQPYPAQPYPAQPYPGQPYPGQPYPGQPYPAPAPPPANLNTTLHLESNDREATLFQNTGSSAFVGYAYRGAFVGQIDFWNRVCRAPCDQPVDSNGSYSIRGNGIVPSAPFTLPTGPVRVNVQAGHVGPRIGGLMLTALGGGTLLSGGLLLAFGSLFSELDSGSGSAFNSRSYYIAGGVLLGAGAAALAGGIVLLVKSRTRVQINGEPTAQLHLPRTRPLYVSAHGLHF